MPVVDGLGEVVGETDETDEEAEEGDDPVGIGVAVPEAEVEADDASVMSMVKVESPVYDCTVLAPDVVVVRSSLEMVKVPVNDFLRKVTVKTNPPSSGLATETS